MAAKKPEVCVECGQGHYVQAMRARSFTYKGKTLVVPRLTGLWCDACGEGVPDIKSVDRYSEAVRLHMQQVNGIAEDNPVLRVRQKLGLTQLEAGALLGVGQHGISRYERGRSKPSGSLAVLLRLIEKRPDVLADLRAA